MRQIKITLIFIIALIAIKVVANAQELSISDLKESSVKIYNKERNRGGTGVILKSFKKSSHILTNKHVCRLIEQGGHVTKDNRNYKITHYKKFSDHDLCLVRIEKSFGVNTFISKTLAKPSDIVYVSGHPNLLPHIVTKGHLSGTLNIRLIVGLRPCDRDNFNCKFFGGSLVLKTFESQVVSNLIKPGSSGSAVFNVAGEIIGVVFAGSRGNFSYGFIVPQKYIYYFLAYSKLYDFTEVGTPVSDRGLKGRIFNYSKCRNPDNKDIIKICKKTKDNMIWRKND